jgi:8-oxo-dGTP pyrophosphatase MutT (NUDIX family)
METTRHFTATVYVVNDGATALHEHERLGKWLPPGGHVDRDELPHQAAVREAREETGLEVEIAAEREGIASRSVRSLPQPAHVQLADVNVHDGQVGHQHVDLVYYGAVGSRTIRPAGDDEADPDRWEWFTTADLRAHDDLETDVAEIGRRAIETVGGREG